MERNYVVVCNRHKGISGSLLFWGNKTKDNAKRRSFGGYRSNFNECEKYTLQEIKESGYNFPIYGKDINHDNYMKLKILLLKLRD